MKITRDDLPTLSRDNLSQSEIYSFGLTVKQPIEFFGHDDERLGPLEVSPVKCSRCGKDINPDADTGYFRPLKERLTKQSYEYYYSLYQRGLLNVGVTHFLDGDWPNMYLVSDQHVPCCQDCMITRFEREHKDKWIHPNDRNIHRHLVDLDFLMDGHSNIRNVTFADKTN